MRTILVIDDDEGVQDVMRKVLERAGFAVETASDGEMGLRMFLAFKPDLVLTDMLMPNREGVETIAAIRSIEPGARIVAMSGGASTLNADYLLDVAAQFGVTATLSKPFKPKELIDTIARSLEADEADGRADEAIKLPKSISLTESTSAVGDDMPAPEGHPTVLIVEDEFLTAMDLNDMLTDLGYKICGQVPSVDQAIAAAETHRPDIVIMDVQLIGGGDGVEAGRQIFSRFKIPSLFATASVDPLTVDRAKAACPLGFLPKPYSQDDVAGALIRVLETGPIPEAVH